MSTTNTSVYKNTAAELKVAEYEEERARDPTAVANWHPSIYLDVFFAAVELHKPETAESLVSDILEHYEGRMPVKCDLLGRVLSRDLSLLNRQTVLRMLQHLKDSSWPGLNALITRDDGLIARKMITPKITDTDRPFLRLFYPAILERLETMRNPKKWKKDRNNTIFRAPLLIHVSFSVVQRLIFMSFNEHALHIFQALVDAGYIPVEALHNVDHSSDNAPLIISMTIIRSCLHWNFRALAASLIAQLITNNPVDKAMIDLNIEIIHSLLSSYQSSREVSASGHLIRQIHPYSPVPDSVIRLFYNTAFAINAKEEAEDLYAFTREVRVLETHEYPPPDSSALPWLMDHFATTSSHTHLARTLATEAVEGDLWIPASSRAQFIARTAALGYATQTRALWERHATGRDGSVVAGNAALMIRMVSLFWNMHKTNLEKVKALEGSKERPGIQEKIARYSSASEDAAILAERVRRAFAFHHAPLAKAPHWHLTSLARACFIVGRISGGYRIFSHLLNRRESPDLYDCNVALTAIAQINPRLASLMIEKMAATGLRPDGVSFGTVLHYAVIQGEQQVVDDMIERIRTLNDTRVSIKTLANLIRAILTLETSSPPEALQKTLASILHLIRSFPELNLRPQPRMGKALVYVAIRVKDGVMAYNFWKIMLQKAAQWDDKEQQNIRHNIAWLIKQPSFPLTQHRNTMLAQLAQNKGTWNAPTT